MEVYNRITLTLHISSNYLDDKLAEQVEAWDGPVTLAVVIPSNQVLKNIRKVQRKLSKMPKAALEKLSAHVLFHSKNGCSIPSVMSLNETAPSRYPANVARNAARMFVRSKFILLGDYEFIFSEEFESRMRKLAEAELAANPKTALVFRLFEVNETIKNLPRRKSELRSLYFSGHAVEFHAMFTRNAHKIPRLIQWFNHEESTDAATIAGILPFTRRDWEPQFVSLNTIPFHDENFPFSLRDNTVLRWEMCRMNYTFALVNDLFMVHRGIKTAKDGPRTREMQRGARSQFRKALKLFKERMDRSYPETKNSCPEFGA